jgi:anti-anti-sigma regulatory factor
VSALAGDIVSLAGVQALDAAVLSSLVRTHGKLARSGRKVRIANATPDVARMLRDLWGVGYSYSSLPSPPLPPLSS